MPAAVKRGTIHAGGLDIGIYITDYRNEYISLTDIAKYRSIQPAITVHNWLRGRDIVEFLGLWEVLHNPGFKGRYGGGIYAHTDIAFEFASWISPEFKLYIIKDYQRLKYDENSRLSLSWNLNREIAKLNYRIHTDAIKENLLPPDLTPEQISCTYANEADLINVALFGMTAKQWREANSGVKGNMRDYASLNQLLVLANMESYNALLIEQKKQQAERLKLLRELAVRQMKTLSGISLEKLPRLTEEM